MAWSVQRACPAETHCPVSSRQLASGTGAAEMEMDEDTDGVDGETKKRAVTRAPEGGRPASPPDFRP